VTVLGGIAPGPLGAVSIEEIELKQLLQGTKKWSEQTAKNVRC